MKKQIYASILVFVMLMVCVFGGCTDTDTTGVSSGRSSVADQPGSELKVYCFSAGKADAFLLYTDDSAVLIDTGESGFGKTIAEKCSELGINKLDYLIITHFDKDHVGGAKKVIESLDVENVLQSNCPKDSTAYEKYIEALENKGIEAVTLTEDMNFTLDGVSYDVNPPEQEIYEDSESNNSSLITSVTIGEFRMLFSGDAENERLSEFLSTSSGKYDVVKLPHHGRWQKTLTDLITETTPSYAVITSSEEEPEEEKTLELLDSYSVETFLTRTAPVIITSDGNVLTVEYEN